MSSDPMDRDRNGRRRRRRGRKERDRESESRETTPAPASQPSSMSRTPIILAKPAPERRSSEETIPVIAKAPEKPIVMVKPREESKMSPVSTQIMSSAMSMESLHATPGYRLQRPVASSSPTPLVSSESSLQSRLAVPADMQHSIKLVDESLQWCENGMEILLDQTHYYVIGVIGPQGVGKSTIMSLIGGANLDDINKPWPFRPQSREVKEVCGHQTTGIDMYVTGERVILLDAQPVLSASVLDYMIHHDKKYPAEYTAAENCHEMQSLQMAAFMYTVCNVVLVVQDWFTDPFLLKFLQTAEMLKPPTPSSGHESNASQDDTPEYYPNVVFVQNRARRSDFGGGSYNTMQQTLAKVFEKSRLRYRGSMSMGNLLPGLNQKTVPGDVNVFLLPAFDNTEKWGDPISSLLPEYRGHPGFDFLMRSFKNQLFSMPRSMLTHTTLTEKNWFHYAARTWEAVKKSQLFSEYNRLLP
ncbi:nonsense-mediated mRNA decay factor SMG9-like [Lineus longissimus]|uniref:nonsense-mediated mRNA decay factor SMG9-like n=1 Tax=Lineus longissimus TaxID=88925 RepID=UPI002B4E41D6